MKVLLFANTDWYLYSFRLSLAQHLRKQGADVLLVSPPGKYGPKMRELGLRWEAAPMHRRSLNPLRELLLIVWLIHFFRRERPDIVHGFTIKSAIYGSLAARLAGVPARVNAIAGMGYVFTSKDLKARVLRPFVRVLMWLALDGKSARLILQNQDDVIWFNQARLVSPARIHLIKGSGVESSRFPARANVAPSGQALRVLLATRLLWDKGVAEYVGAARQLRAQGRNIRFLLAGAPDPGNPASITIADVQGWVTEDVVEWLGHVDDMPVLFKEVDLVVLPSYREGLPKTLIEAAACALPLITTDVPGCREVVTNEVDGLLVPVRDAVSLADAIRRLDDDRELARQLGLAAREKLLQEFDERIVLGKTLSVYQELLPDVKT